MFGSKFRGRLAVVLALGIAGGIAAGAAAVADETLGGDAAVAMAASIGNYEAKQTTKLGVDKSIIVDLPRDARDVLVSNQDIVDAVVRTPRRIFLTGKKAGETDIIIFDRAGGRIVSLDVMVGRSTNQLEPIINRLIPGAYITVDSVNGNIVLSGTVKNAADAKKAVDIAAAFAKDGNGAQQAPSASVSKTATSADPATGTSFNISTVTQTAPTAVSDNVINLLAIEGEDQVQLKVSIAEVQRSLVKQLGIDWSATNLNIGGLVVNALTEFPFPVTGSSPSAAAVVSNAADTLAVKLSALEQTGLYRTLAEPTLTAISGESASFLAGGEFPVPVGRDTDGTVTVAYKPFGVALTFSPVVMSEGRISLRVKTEVSELSQEGAIQLVDISLPSLKVRRAETTLELPSGGSMVLGGLLQDNVKQSLAGLPGLKSLPILGTLFRSRDFQRNEFELVIIVTPYLVKPVARSALARSDAGFSTPDDIGGTFLGKLNKVYGAQGKPAPDGTYQGGVGYIIE